jgi:hypothetical protein
MTRPEIGKTRTERRARNETECPEAYQRGLTIIGTENRVKRLTLVERPLTVDFRVPVITMRFSPSSRFISAGEYRGSDRGFL